MRMNLMMMTNGLLPIFYSVIPLVIASLRHGVAVVEVTLLSLGSGQVAKAVFIDKNIEAYLDEHKFADAALLNALHLSMNLHGTSFCPEFVESIKNLHE